MNDYVVVLLFGTMLGIWALVWEVASGLRGLNRRLERLAERLESGK